MNVKNGVLTPVERVPTSLYPRTVQPASNAVLVSPTGCFGGIKHVACALATLCCLALAGKAGAGILPDREMAVLTSVADRYNLTTEQRRLLFVIRRIENGRNGLELGVGDGIANHPARRYAGDFEKSLALQAEWAAGTIKKRFTGDVDAFAKRYCPVNWVVWSRNAKSYLAKF